MNFLRYALLILSLVALCCACAPSAGTAPTDVIPVSPTNAPHNDAAMIDIPSPKIVTLQDSIDLRAQASADPSRQPARETVDPVMLDSITAISNSDVQQDVALSSTDGVLVGRVPVNKRLYYNTTNSRYKSPLEVTLVSFERMGEGALELHYSISNPSETRRIIDPRGLRSEGNYVQNMAGDRFEASTTLAPVIIPARNSISYTLRYLVGGDLEQITVFPGLDDVSEDVASTFVPFGLELVSRGANDTN